MTLFRKLPGFKRTPAGLEWIWWRRLPALWFWGSALLLLPWLALHFNLPDGASAATQRQFQQAEYILAGVLLLHWTLLLTLAIGCLIVLAMKGPAYVADAFPDGGQLADRPPGGR